jgi:two-component system cell cycle sensor histidine kinase/response regulator CckA
VLDALAEPAAVLSKDGRILRANTAWFDAFGSTRRLPKTPEIGAFYTALTAAKRGDTGRAILSPRTASGRRRSPAWAGAASWSAPRRRAGRAPRRGARRLQRPRGRRPGAAVAAFTASFDGFAAAAPFGAAALEGSDPLEGVIVQANAALQAMMGGRAAPGAVFGDLLEPASKAEAGARLQAKRGGPVEVKLALDPPRPAHLYVAGGEGRLLAYLVDVSEQKQLELQLSQAQKMQAIGQLAGGVAHDFNNLLTAIQLRLDELLHRHPVGDPSYEGLNEIRQTATRAADLVRKLLAFSRKQTVQRETLDLGHLMSEFETLLSRILREDTKLETDYGRNLPMVRADKSQLETGGDEPGGQRRGTPCARTGGGVVRIKTDRLLAQRVCAAWATSGAPAGEYALIEVAGHRARASLRTCMDKIFEPFFTTKPVGEGTASGLATVYGIVKQADGWIHLTSEPGKGAAFRIFLPVYHPPPERGRRSRRSRRRPVRATSPEPAASCSSRTRTPCAASPPPAARPRLRGHRGLRRGRGAGVCARSTRAPSTC